MAASRGESSRWRSSVTVLDWLLDSDPSVRWQVMRDLTEGR
jgi:hypothetical protein